MNSAPDNNTNVTEKMPTPRLAYYDLLESLIFAAVASILILVFLVRLGVVDGPSMMNTLQDGDRVIVSNLFFTPEYGDVVFIKTNYDKDTPLVKRVIATEGQKVHIDYVEGVIFVDGKMLEEPYTAERTYVSEDFEGNQTVTVPEGCVFIMGDNRNNSTDSRDDRVGFVDLRDIIGKVYFVLIPGEGATGARDWSRIGPVK